ncbi:DUF3325 family protein [Pseudoalteromonas undina]|uniref:DUF3325 family protein n=1 Tax=Pseudoalteromonas TaxID=53246 RepID=UPI0018686DC0|nr:DUF3325 family protein [Pseudoalteromonas undina]
MIFFIIWFTAIIGFSVLSLGMARHRKSLQLAALSTKQEKKRLWLGLIILSCSLIIAFFGFPKAEAVPIWFGILTLSVLKVVIYLSVKLNPIKQKSTVKPNKELKSEINHKVPHGITTT